MISNKNYYKNKLIFITGGSEGIGKAIALEATKYGAHVIISSRSQKKCQLAFEEILSHRVSDNQQLHFATFDLRNAQMTQKELDNLVQVYGVPDILINCAGYGRPGYIDELDLEPFRSMMDLNYFGTLHAIKALLPHWIKQRKGQILNTSSIAGFIALFGYTGYCASKFAVNGFSEALRSELKPYGIKVSILCPPNTRTPGFDLENQFKPDEVLKTEEKIKVCDPEEVAVYALKKLSSNKLYIIPTFDGRLSYWASRHFPFLVPLFVKRKKIN